VAVGWLVAPQLMVVL